MDPEFKIKDIALLAGVSIGTVDRVIHNRGRVSEETAARIRKIVEETGYSPNLGASRLSRSAQWTVAAVFPLPDQDHGFWRDAERGLRRSYDDFGSMGLKSRTFNFDRDSDASLEDAVGAAAEICDGILLAPVIPDAAIRAVSKLPASYPRIFFDTPLPGDFLGSFVGQDAFAAGRMGARLTSLAVPEPGRIAAVALSPNDHHIRQRIEGFRSYFQNPDEVRLLELPFSASPGDIAELTETVLTAKPAIDGLYVANASVGVIAESLAHHSRKPRLVGHDLTQKSMTMLQASAIDFLITQHPALQTYEAMRCFWRRFALNQPFPTAQLLPIDVLSQENWAYYREI